MESCTLRDRACAVLRLPPNKYGTAMNPIGLVPWIQRLYRVQSRFQPFMPCSWMLMSNTVDNACYLDICLLLRERTNNAKVT